MKMLDVDCEGDVIIKDVDEENDPKDLAMNIADRLYTGRCATSGTDSGFL